MSVRFALAVAAGMVATLAGFTRHLSAAQAVAPVAAVHDPEVIVVGRQVERALAPGQEHRYQLVLGAGETASVMVEQRGIDVRVQLRGIDGGTIAEFQNEVRRDGQETVEVTSDDAGPHLLAVVAPPALEAGAYAIRVISRRVATPADHVLREAWTMRTTAARLQAAAKADDARPLLERAAAIVESVRGPGDPTLGVLLFELAGNLMARRDDAGAERLYQRALGILEGAWGGDHPYPAMIRMRLALLLRRAGHGTTAEPLLRDASDVIERTLGPGHPWFATCLMNLAILRNEAGDRERAVALDLRVLAIYEALGETGATNYAGTLNNLGDLYRQIGDYTRAEDVLLRALALAERIEGTESYHLSILYQSLGIVARERKDYTRAARYYQHGLAIRERLLGADHPDVAQILNNLAVVQHLTGDTSGSIATLLRVIGVWDRARGPQSAGALNATGNIARMYAAGENVPLALDFQRRADTILERQLQLQLAVGSEREKLAFMAMVNERTDRTVSLSLREAAGDPDAARLAASVLLQRKGRVQDAMIDTFAALRQRISDPADQARLDELRATTAQLASLAFEAPGAASPDRRASRDALEATRERLEAALSARSAQLGAHLRPVSLEAVQAAIPEHAALIEFVVFRPFDPRAERNAEAYGPARYAAYVIRRTGPPRGMDLGSATEIDAVLSRVRQALRDPARTDLRQLARAADALILQPLRAWCPEATRLLVSPDGALNLVPLEAFVDEDGRYLVERVALNYVTSGRDLLRAPAPAGGNDAVVVVANPYFGAPGPADAAAARPAAAGRGAVATQDPAAMYFAPLAGTGAEARAIHSLFPRATMLTGRQASKVAVERVTAPRILHIASHGFFLAQGGENPLLRSGLALAGANAASGQRDGILTALEASSLDLRGTRLVTLSACDTGVGEVRNGEGVYGLRRAFVLAGAESVVITLWPVSDYVSREMMQMYYSGLRAGRGRGDALRDAKLTMLRRAGRDHPFYWASVIQSGEWASLDGIR